MGGIHPSMWKIPLGLMTFLEEEQSGVMEMTIRERVNNKDIQGFLNWSGEAPDMTEVPHAKMQSLFPRVTKRLAKTRTFRYRPRTIPGSSITPWKHRFQN
jgi:hypothetical protein